MSTEHTQQNHVEGKNTMFTSWKQGSHNWAIKLLLLSLPLSLSLAQSIDDQFEAFTKAGLIYEVDGQATLIEGSRPRSMDGQRHLETGQRVRTEAGRVQLILAPGVYLAVDQNSEIAMVKSHLSDLQLDFISGSISVRVDDDAYVDGILVRPPGSEVRFDKRGHYRVDIHPEKSLHVRVFGGRASVAPDQHSKKIRVKKKWSLTLPGNRPEKFDTLDKDDLENWHEEKIASIEAVATRVASSLGQSKVSIIPGDVPTTKAAPPSQGVTAPRQPGLR